MSYLYMYTVQPYLICNLNFNWLFVRLVTVNNNKENDFQKREKKKEPKADVMDQQEAKL